MKRKKKLPKRKKRSIFPPNAYIILIPSFILAVVIYFYPYPSSTRVLGASTEKAVEVCSEKNVGNVCSYMSEKKLVNGVCEQLPNQDSLICATSGMHE